MRVTRSIALLAIGLCTLGALVVSAQRPAVSLPVIVVFHDDAPFQAYAADYRPDARANANPIAWNHNRGVSGAVQSLERRHGFQSDHVYSAAIRGFAARLSARQLADVEAEPLVSYVELDGVMSIVQGQSPTAPKPGRGGGGGDSGGGSSCSDQTVPWGIGKVAATTSSAIAGDCTGAVPNVVAYVIDTGIDVAHPDLNVVNHVNYAGGPNADCHGHGTHVAGTVAAIDNMLNVVGVAPGVPLVGVKVLGCGGSGTTSGVIAGIDFVTADAPNLGAGVRAIANMSLGGGASNVLDTAVRNSAAAGVFYSIAAGNSGADACNSSPARAGEGNNGIMTTAATTGADQETSWSNYGSCVDIWAPGSSILSTKKGGGTTTMSGTSMAAPHVGGGGALYLSTHTSASPTNVESALKGAADEPGTKSKDNRSIIRLNVGGF